MCKDLQNKQICTGRENICLKKERRQEQSYQAQQTE